MSGPGDCSGVRQNLGVYIVGAIDPAERAAVDGHLTHCPGCREEVAGLAGLPALLGRVPVTEIEQMDSDEAAVAPEPSVTMLDSLLSKASVRRRARRRHLFSTAAVAAVIALGGGIAIGGAVTGPHGQPAAVTAPATELARGHNPATGAGAAVYYTSSASGTKMQVQVTGVPRGAKCDFWVITAAGKHIEAGRWKAGPDSMWYSASSTYPSSQLRGFDLSVGKSVLVTVPLS